MSPHQQHVDHAALRVNQALIISLLIGAFVFDWVWLVAAVGVAMAYGTLRRQPGFRFVYTGLLRLRGWVRADVLPDHAEPHVFAQALGAVVVVVSVVVLLAGQAVLGWALTWLVVALAALNLFAGFCAGCAVYYWLNRLGLPGFAKSAPAGRFPGLRPKRH
jgi:hypothetical protein